MNKNLTALFFITLILLQFGFSSFAQTQKLTDRLLQKLQSAEANDYVKTLVILEDQVDVAAMDEVFYAENASIERRTVEVITALKQKAYSTQKNLLLNLAENERTDEVFKYQSMWVVNMIVVEAKPSVIYDLATKAEVEYIDEDGLLERDLPKKGENTGSATESVEDGVKIINADKLWELGITGAGRIVMGIDTGVDPTHPALSHKWRGNHVPADQAWIDPGGGSTTPNDCDSHGTHTMGTMTGRSNTTSDTVGVAIDAEWIAAKTICSSPHTSNTVTAFQWSMDPDGDSTTISDMPDAICNSWYDPNVSSTECTSIYVNTLNALEAVGIGVVFSAGNSGPGSTTITEPKNINTSLVNSWATAAIDGPSYLGGSNDPITSFSSRGPSICGGTGSLLIKPEASAPGNNVRSSVPGGGYGTKSGTSMAAPHVVGAIALLRQFAPNLTGLQIKLALYNTAKDLGTVGEDNTYGTGLIDVYAAFLSLGTPDIYPPDAIVDLSVNDVTSNDLSLMWTVPYDSSMGGISDYDVRWSSSMINDTNDFAGATQIPFEGQPGDSGDTEMMQVAGLDFATTYYFAVRSKDVWGNWSDLSNVVEAVTFDAPQIDVTPDSLHVEILNTIAVQDTIFISNTSLTSSTLDYNVVLENNTFPESRPLNMRIINVALAEESDYDASVKSDKEEPMGMSLEGSGGPDTFGYEWIDSDEPNGPAYVWNDISTTGTAVASWTPTGTFSGTDEGYAGPFSLGFPFKFYGDVKNDVYVSSNGIVMFGTLSSNVFTNGTIPNSAVPNDMIAPFWDDLDGGSQGDVYYQQDGDKFIIQFDNWPKYNTSSGLTFQVVLHSSGKILVYYENMTASLTSCSVGIENGTGTDALQVAYNATYVKNGLALQFAAEPDWLSADAISGRLYNANTVGVELTFSSEDYPLGNYSMDVVISSNDPVTPSVTVPVTMEIVGSSNPAPKNIIAGNNFDGIVPLTWDRILSTATDTIDHYKVFRASTPGGPYTLIGNTNSTVQVWNYIDNSVTNGNTYFYVATALYTDGYESDYSDEVNSTPITTGMHITLPHSLTAPTNDGTINSSEWNDAYSMDIRHPGVSQPITLYMKNDDSNLYIALDDPNNISAADINDFIIYFDDDNNNTWDTAAPSSEGYYILGVSSGAVYRRVFKPIHGNYPLYTIESETSNPTGFISNFSMSSGHIQFEVSIDLSTSVLNASPGDEIGIRIASWNEDLQSSAYYTFDTGTWPYGSINLNPVSYGKLTIVSQNAVVLFQPNDNTQFMDTDFTLYWNKDVYATGYSLQVATDTSFNNLIIDETSVVDTFFQLTGLNNLSDYYWRVKGNYPNEEAIWSDIWQFQTGEEYGWAKKTSGTENYVNKIQTFGSVGWIGSSTILRTMNNGTLWEWKKNSGSGSSYFLNADLGWAGVFYNEFMAPKIIKTTDGGSNWSEYYFTGGMNFHFYSLMHFFDENNGVILDEEGRIHKTTDGGNSWTYTSRIIVDAFEKWANGLFYSNHNIWWAASGTGGILKTTDGGYDWSALSASGLFDDLYFINNNTGWAVGHGGAIVYTNNGGTNWQSQTSNTTNNLRSVYFVDMLNGWAAGEEGTIIKTTDGGQTWISESTITSENIYDLYFVDKNHGWAVGSNGTLMRYSAPGPTNDIVLLPIPPTITYPDYDISVNIDIGSVDIPVNDLQVISFDLLYTNTAIIDYSTSYQVGDFWSTSTPGVLVIPDDANGKISISLYLIGGSQSGYGSIISLDFHISPGAVADQVIDWSFGNLAANNSSGGTIDLSPQTASTTIKAGLPVWPGDTNNDGVVNIIDINPIIINFGDTGPVRQNANISWTEQFCLPWTPESDTYVDCSGNGQVDIIDINPVIINFGNSHTVTASPQNNDKNKLDSKINSIAKTTATAPLTGTSPSNMAPGEEYWVEVTVGDVANPVTDMKVISFELLYDNTDKIDYVTFELGDFLSGATPAVVDEDENGKVSASAFNVNQGYSGYGIIFRFKFLVKPSNPSDPAVEINNSWGLVQANRFDGEEQPINPVPFTYEILPVELVSFTVNSSGGNTAQVKWETASEVNNYGFEVERKNKKDNSTWRKITFIDGAGNSNSPKLYSFSDNNLIGGTHFVYRLKQIDTDGTFSYSDEIEIEVIPTEYALYQNYPNPFNPSTKIRFSIVEPQRVDLRLYNAIGEQVIVLFNQNLEAGYHEVEFRANDLAGGIYFYRIIAGQFVQTKKMMLLK